MGKNDDFCVDLPGSEPYNGNEVVLWKCNGMDSQTWVIDNHQIRYGAQEDFCIDARDGSSGTQLMLWECNGSDHQTWGYDENSLQLHLFGFVGGSAVRQPGGGPLGVQRGRRSKVEFAEYCSPGSSPGFSPGSSRSCMTASLISNNSLVPEN